MAAACMARAMFDVGNVQFGTAAQFATCIGCPKAASPRGLPHLSSPPRFKAVELQHRASDMHCQLGTKALSLHVTRGLGLQHGASCAACLQSMSLKGPVQLLLLFACCQCVVHPLYNAMGWKSSIQEVCCTGYKPELVTTVGTWCHAFKDRLSPGGLSPSTSLGLWSSQLLLMGNATSQC